MEHFAYICCLYTSPRRQLAQYLLRTKNQRCDVAVFVAMFVVIATFGVEN